MTPDRFHLRSWFASLWGNLAGVGIGVVLDVGTYALIFLGAFGLAVFGVFRQLTRPSVHVDRARDHARVEEGQRGDS